MGYHSGSVKGGSMTISPFYKGLWGAYEFHEDQAPTLAPSAKSTFFLPTYCGSLVSDKKRL